jgi:putative NADPH-quinone reductase
MSRIVIIEGHPDPRQNRFGHALAAAYARGAVEAGHEVRRIEVCRIDFPLLRTKDEWENGTAPSSIRAAQDDIAWAEHLVILYPLWLGSMPALLKAFLEQVLRPGFAMKIQPGGSWEKLLTGKSARIIVTMGMPAFIYQWYFRAHSLKSLKRSVLRFVGINAVSESLIGSIETCSDARRGEWLHKLENLGRAAK